MSNPEIFYNQKLREYENVYQGLRRKLVLSGLLRLTVFLTAAIIVYYTWAEIRLVIPLAALAIFIFIYLVARHSSIQKKCDFYKALIAVNSVELAVLKGDFSGLDPGDRYRDSSHDYSEDIDLFGEKSFFQYLNRTSLQDGSDFLAASLLENSTQFVLEKQRAVQELARLPEWRQEFSALASLVQTEMKAGEISEWMNRHRSFSPRNSLFLTGGFTAVSLILISAYFLGWISGYFPGIWFFTGLVISGRFGKKVSALSENTSRAHNTFEQFYKLILKIETQEFSSFLLREKQGYVTGSSQKASEMLKKLTRYTDALDQRNNLIVRIFGNGLLLWDIRHSFLIEKWIRNHKDQVSGWFDTLAFFDAYNTLGNFSFNHPGYVFPLIQDGDFILKVKAGAHPLIPESQRVSNDYEIKKSEFFIITGANMAGKSTFLRTVSLQLVMGNAGLPICAESAVYNPVRLITSMRTTDSLSKEESYFFSELKRLKFIVEAISREPYFVILDEILKGTNSTDKAIGSRKFVEKLVAKKASGIIATHDLSLCEVAGEYPEVKNYFFDADIKENNLFFDYTLKPGICENMNASFLLKKMEIID